MPIPLSRGRSIALVALLTGTAAACGDGGTGPNRLTPTEVGGIYHVCSLAFQPNQQLLPAIQIRGEAIDTTAGATQSPQLFVDNLSYQFLFRFSVPGSTLPRDFAGSYSTGSQAVFVAFTNPSEVLSRLLLPSPLELEFQSGPNRLSFTRSNHDVPRPVYAQIKGISEEGLSDPIRGTVAGQFRVGGCS